MMNSVRAPRITRRDVLIVVIVVCAIGVLLGVTGLTASSMFRQPSRAKWAITFAGPLAVLLILTTGRPLRILVGALIVLAPLGSVGALLLGVHVPANALVVLLTLVAAVLAGPAPRSLSPVGLAGIGAGLFLLIPMLTGSGVFAHVMLFGAAGLTAWLVSIVVREHGGIDWILGAFSFGAFCQALIAIWELVTKHQINFYGAAGSTVFGSHYFFGYGQTFRPFGTFYDPISLGNVLAVAIPLQLLLVVRQPTQLRRLIGTAVIAVNGAALLLTLSRMSWVGAIVGVVFMLVVLPTPLRGRALVPLIPLVIVVGVLATGANSGAFGSRFGSILDPTTSAASRAEDQARVVDWDASLSIWAQHPVAGVGFGNDPTALSEHLPLVNSHEQSQSVYFQLLAEAGVLGAAALVLLLLTHIAVLQQMLNTSQRAYATALLASTLALLIGWTTDVTVRYAPVASCMAVLFGCAAGLWQTSRKREDASASVRAAVPAAAS
jgi:hypothetical protein